MKPVVYLGLAIVALTLSTAPAAGTPRQVQGGDATRDLLLYERHGQSFIQSDGDSERLPLPRGARVSEVRPAGDGWIAAAVAVVEGEPRLALLQSDAAGISALETPTARASFLHQPVPLIEGERLVGLAWLQGDGPTGFEVRAAAWNGRTWETPTIVSAADLESQLALSGTVLADGSWLLAWAAVNGSDDDVFFARRRIDGSWRARRRLHPPNDVPDIRPSVLATASGSLVAWNTLDDGDYRVVAARPGTDEPTFVGPRGSVLPRLLAVDDGSLLRFKSVKSEQWVVVELDSLGAPLRYAAVDSPGYDAPIVFAGAQAVIFEWPQSPPAAEVAYEAPWQPWSEGALDPGVPAPSAIDPPTEPEGAAVRYRAFGDSITRATGWPIFPSIVFDVADDPGDTVPAGQSCGQSGNTFNIRCGYNLRLEDVLDATFASDVANDGRGGETTAGGLGRIDSVLGGGTVVLIMEGSNDITGCGVSTTTIRNNVGAMVNKANVAGSDALIASVTRRRRVDSAGNPLPDPCGEDSLTADLANKLSSLAANKNREYADVFSTIDPSLGDADYWDAIGVGDGVGHPDASGYDKVETAFSPPILADSPLDAPDQNEPSGAVDESPTFSWETTGNARLYRIAITGPNGPTTETWFDALAACSGSTCTGSVGSLEAGSYDWSVAGTNLRGLGTVSGDLAFEVFTEKPEAAPATDQPIGDCPDCYASPTVTLDFEFEDVSDASEYDVEISDSGGVISVENFLADDICGADCSAPSSTALSAGDYEWRVRPVNPIGNGPYSGRTAFTVYDTVPTVPAQLNPLEPTFDSTPLYRWTQVPGAQHYRLTVTEGGGFTRLFPVGDICNGLTCETEPADVLAIGGHDWRVRGQNPLGNGDFSPDAPFEVLDCDAFPTNVVVDSTDTGSADYRACPGTVTSESGFKVSSSETVSLHGTGGVLIEEIEVEAGATLRLKTD